MNSDELPVVPRRCQACGYGRFDRVVAEAPLQKTAFSVATWPWFVWVLAVVLFPITFVVLVLWAPFSLMRQTRKTQQVFDGIAYEQFRRCPSCGSDRVQTVSEDGFIPGFPTAPAGPIATARQDRDAPVVLQCPSCGTQNRVRGEGRRRCGRCRSEFTITRPA